MGAAEEREREGMGARVGHLLVAGIAGFMILVLEFAAVRLLAPAFGQSIHVWSTVIGVVLFALACGYAAGGRLGAWSRSGRPLYVAHGLAALATVATAAWGPRLCAALVPTGWPHPGGLPLGMTGSLVATVVLFGPAAFLLAMTSPFLIRLEAHAGTEGRATGGIYAFGTIGSLAACFVAPLWMLQVLGTRTTLLVAAALGGVLCLTGLLLARPVGTASANARPDPEGEASPPARIAGILWLVALMTGWAGTVVEFASVRFMSPWFGQSNPIWSNVVGLILLSLALGSWIGGRWADAARARGPQGGRSLVGALSVAGLAVGLACVVGPVLLGALMPDGLDSLRILVVANHGSRAASLLLFGLPMVLLGAVPPFLVSLSARGAKAGRAAGRLFAWSTVGGLVGCLTTAPWLVPWVGSRGALLLAAGGVVAVACGLLRYLGGARGRVHLIAYGALLLIAVGLGWQVACRPALRVHDGQLAEIESAYQTVRVVRQDIWMGAPAPNDTIVPAWLPAAAKARTIFLRHDEDAETYQSVLVEDDAKRAAWLTGGRYFEHMAIGAFFAPRPNGRPLKVLILGYAGGTVYRTLRQTYPAAMDVVGVEIDPGVIEIARAHLAHRALETPRPGLVGDRLRLVTNEDARTVVNALPQRERFDLILVDAYARTNYVPFQLATVEFFRRLAAHLTDGGWVGVNVLGHGFRGPVAKAIARTVAHVYGECWAAPNPAYPGNVILWSRPGADRGPRLIRRPVLHAGLRAAAFAVERYLVRYDPKHDGGVLLTDDKSPSDRLADRELGL